MTDEEIKKIARAYGESEANCFDYDMYSNPDFRHKLKAKSEANKAKAVLEWLSHDYCIVEKEKVKTEYDFWHQRLPKMCRLADKVNNDPDTARMWGKIEVLNDIFGKEMFEEGKK